MAKRSKKRVRHLTIFLLKDDITQSKDALKDPDSLTSRKLREGLPFKGRFYFQPQQEKPPSWLSLVRPGLAEPLNLTNQSTAAVLLLRSAGRRFAITFGYGRNPALTDQLASRPWWGYFAKAPRLRALRARDDAVHFSHRA